MESNQLRLYSEIFLALLCLKFSADRCHRLQLSLQTHHNSEIEGRGRTQFTATANAYHSRLTPYRSYVANNNSFILDWGT